MKGKKQNILWFTALLNIWDAFDEYKIKPFHSAFGCRLKRVHFKN